MSALAVEAFARDPRPWGIYSRISARRGDGHGATLGRERQEPACVEYVHRIDPDAEFVFYWDNESGWNKDKTRDDYERMQADVRAGRLAGTVAWHADRYTRQPEQLEQQFRDAQKGRAQLHTVIGGHIDSKLTPRILAAVAAEESDQKSRRTVAKHKQIAEQGYSHGGRRRFGYTDHTMMTIDKKEAKIIRDLIARCLKGESLGSLARSLEERGIRTPEWTEEKPTVWRGQNVRHLLMRPHLAGLRVHKPRDAEEPTLHEAKWPAIITRAEHDAITSYLSDSGRRTNYTTARVYLLSGLVVCDVCDSTVKARRLWKEAKKGRDVRSYYCGGPNSHVARRQDLVDAVVEEAIIDRLSRMDASGALIDENAADEVTTLEEERKELDATLDRLTQRNLKGDLSDSQLQRSTRHAEARMSEIDDELKSARARVARPSAVLDKMTGPGAAETWSQASLDRKRAVIDFLCERIAIRPSGKGYRFKPEDVLIDYRERD